MMQGMLLEVGKAGPSSRLKMASASGSRVPPLFFFYRLCSIKDAAGNPQPAKVGLA